METWKPLIGLVLLVLSFGLIAWKLSTYFRRGYRDHVWVFVEVRSAALKIVLIFGIIAALEMVWRGDEIRALWFAGFALLGPLVPLAAYAMGRLAGMWRRSRMVTID